MEGKPRQKCPRNPVRSRLPLQRPHSFKDAFKLEGLFLFFSAGAATKLVERNFYKIVWHHVSMSLKSFTLFDQIIPLLGCYPKEIRNTDKKKVWANILITVILIIQSLKETA